MARAGGLSATPGLRELLDALPTAIYTTDAHGKITFYNEAAAQLAGRRPRLGVDEWCVSWRLYAPDGAPLAHDQGPMAVALKEDRPVRGREAIAERPDGTRTPFLACPTPLHDADGALVGAVNVLVDISERKAAETRQRELFAELNHRAKNNMQILHALLSTAHREAGSVEARDAIAGAVQRVGAMAAAQRILYRAGHGCYSAEDFMDSVCEAAAQMAGDGVSITCHACAAELPNETATPLALIVNELVANAARHSLDGAGKARVRVELVRDGGELVLSVEDDGPGFTLATASRRASGLSLVKGLANQIGARFEIERTPKCRCSLRFSVDEVAA